MNYLLFTIALCSSFTTQNITDASDKKARKKINQTIEDYFDLCQKGKYTKAVDYYYPDFVKAQGSQENFKKTMQETQKRSMEMINRCEMVVSYNFNREQIYDFQTVNKEQLTIVRAYSKYESSKRTCVIAYSLVLISSDKGKTWKIIDTIDDDADALLTTLHFLKQKGFTLEAFSSKANCT